MCDSHISETCPLDFTNYCPVDSLAKEARTKPTHKAHSRVHSTWFSRRAKGTSTRNNQEVITAKQCSSKLLEQECSASGGSETCSNCPDAGRDVYPDSSESSSDEEYNLASANNWSLEKPSLYVSQEELDALKGCVTRRRAVFSPSPSSSPAHSVIHQKHKKQHSPSIYSSLPAESKHLAMAEETSRHVRQSSLEYDHLTDFNPHVSTDSISVQFRLQGFDVSEEHHGNSGEVQKAAIRRYGSANNEHSLSYSIPERLGSDVTCPRELDDCRCGAQKLQSSGSCDLQLVQEKEKCSPDDELPRSVKASNQPLKERKSVAVSSPSIGRANLILQHHSPFRSLFNSPLLAKHHLFGSGVLRTCDAGSNYSLYSQTTTLSDRQHCSYSKGVDGNIFKDRTDNVLSWFSEFSDQQRNMMLMKLLEQCDCAQMHFLSVQMEPILHDGCPHNCEDLLSWLPFHIFIHIFSFLDPVSLCEASVVSKDWLYAVSQPNLWKRFCRLEKWKLSVSGELKYQAKFMNPDGSIRWKCLFAEKFRLKRNWLKGYCTVRTFEGHTQGISCIQFDDTRIVSGSWDKTIKVWNRRTNTVWAALTLAGHSGTVRCLHLHNNRLVSGSSDRTLKVWDLATDKVGWVGAACRATMVGHMHTVRCLQADDTKVISGSYDQTLKIWDIKTGQCQRTLRGHTDAVLCLQFDRHKVVSGSKDKTIRIWSLPDGLCTLTFHGHQAAVSCLHFDETRIISGALDRLIKMWNLTTGECIRTIDWIRSEGHTRVIRHLQADSWKIISAADDKTLKVWNVHTGNRLLTLKSHSDGVTSLQFNDEVIVSGSYDKTVKLWDFSSC